jgi:hypothetical protein
MSKLDYEKDKVQQILKHQPTEEQLLEEYESFLSPSEKQQSKFTFLSIISNINTIREELNNTSNDILKKSSLLKRLNRTYSNYKKNGVKFDPNTQPGLVIKLNNGLNELQTSAGSYLKAFESNLNNGVLVNIGLNPVNNLTYLVDGLEELTYPTTNEQMLKFLKEEMWDLKSNIEIQIINLKTQKETPLSTLLNQKYQALIDACENSTLSHVSILARNVEVLVKSRPITQTEKEILALIRKTFSEYIQEVQNKKNLEEIKYNSPENTQFRIIENINTLFGDIESYIKDTILYIQKMTDPDIELENHGMINKSEKLIETVTNQAIKENLLNKLKKLKKQNRALTLKFIKKKREIWSSNRNLIPQNNNTKSLT